MPYVYCNTISHWSSCEFLGATHPIARLIAAGRSDWELSRRICFWWPYLIKLVTAVHHPLVAYDAARRGPGAWSPQAPAHWVHWSRLITSPPPHTANQGQSRIYTWTSLQSIFFHGNWSNLLKIQSISTRCRFHIVGIIPDDVPATKALGHLQVWCWL